MPNRHKSPGHFACGLVAALSGHVGGMAPEATGASMAVLLLVLTPLRACMFLGMPSVTRISMEAVGFWGCCNPRTAHNAWPLRAATRPQAKSPGDLWRLGTALLQWGV